MGMLTLTALQVTPAVCRLVILPVENFIHTNDHVVRIGLDDLQHTGCLYQALAPYIA